jgi:allophanate hydrolase
VATVDGSALGAVRRAFEAIEAEPRPGIWIALVDRAVAERAAAAVDARVAAGERLPLAGSTLAVKDNIDVAGTPTTAGCPAFAFEPTTSAPAVQALVDAGAVVVGKTNLDQFATGLVGTRSPYGTCPNAHWDGLVSGGSSSGSAVAVALGLVDLALGTDTAGSGRVPAAANGIVGVKPTRGLISTLGVVPACASLDCVSVFARTVGEAASAAAIASATPARTDDAWRRPRPATSETPPAGPLRIGVPARERLVFDGDHAGAARFSAAVAELLAACPDVEVVDVDLGPFLDAAELLYEGSFVAERYDAVGPFVAAHPDEVDPVVGSIILGASAHDGWEVFRDQTRLRGLAAESAPTWERIDVLVVPSVPRVPTVAEVQADPIGVNSMLGTYTNFVNLLDLAAVTVPVPSAGDPQAGPPPSLTLIGPAWSDETLARLASALA